MLFASYGTKTLIQERIQSIDSQVIFRSGPSPYILGATLKKHVSQYAEKFPSTTDELLINAYVDHVQSGGSSNRSPQGLWKKVAFTFPNGTATC